MKLSILIPQYNETTEEVKNLLNSIAAQQRIDFKDIEVCILNDGSDIKLDASIFSRYPYDIYYTDGEVNRKPALARQWLFDHSQGEYVMYCDADDSFWSIMALSFILEQIDRGFEVLITDFYEETFVDAKHREHIIVRHECNKTFIHGKVFSRKFLIDNDIKWLDIFPAEDNYYSKLCQAVASEVKYVDIPLYIWKWRKNSIVRTDAKTWSLSQFHAGSRSEECLIDELFKRGLQGQALYYVAMHIYSCYFTLNSEIWRRKENAQYKVVAIERARYIYQKYKDWWVKIPQANKDEIFESNLQLQINKGFANDISINDWISEVLEQCK